MEMYPLSFEEFLLAMGKDIAVNFLKTDNENISSTLHSLLLDDVRKYFFIGGMPECVKIFAEKGKYQPVFDVQSHLIETFREDFSKYAPLADKRCLNSVFINSARSVGKQIIYSHLTEGFSNPTIKNAFDLLTKARLLYRIPSASPGGIPLAASASKKKFKALFADIGLMQNLCGIRTGEELFKSDLLAIYNGALAEQFVGQELLVQSHNPLYYWARDAKSSTAEVDYLFEKNGKIIPLEVKSGSGGRLKSLHLLLKTFFHIDSGYVCSSASFATLPEQKLKFIPLYAVSRLV
jgi:predicted AAA+ superfamily ATPase